MTFPLLCLIPACIALLSAPSPFPPPSRNLTVDPQNATVRRSRTDHRYSLKVGRRGTGGTEGGRDGEREREMPPPPFFCTMPDSGCCCCRSTNVVLPTTYSGFTHLNLEGQCLPNQYCYRQFSAAIKKQANGSCYIPGLAVCLLMFLLMGLLWAIQKFDPITTGMY